MNQLLSLPVMPPETCGDQPRARITLSVKSEAASLAEQPVTVGLPFPKGMLADDASLSLLDPEDCPVGLQTTPLARWSDGSIKWLLLDFLLPSTRQGSTSLTLFPGAADAPPAPEESPLRVRESPQAVVIDTGAATFHLDRATLRPFTRVLLGGRDVLGGEAARVLLTDPKGRRAEPRVDRVAVEARGPVRATVKLEGSFTGRVRCRFVARLCFFAGTGLVRLRLTLHNPNRARHRGGLWDLGDPGSMLFRDLSLELHLAGTDEPRVHWTAEPGDAPSPAAAGDLEIYQDSSGGENWQSKNHVNRLGRVPCSFRGYRRRHGAEEAFGLRANPVVSLDGGGGTVTAAVPEFWQQFPRAITVRGRTLRLQPFPGQFNDLFELQGGEQKTHTLWLHFGPGGDPEQLPLDWVHQPARACADPDWYAESGAVPYLLPASTEPDARLESYLAEVVGGANSFFARREIIDEYGWRNYGEVYADHEGAYYKGPAPVISHYNNQYDVVYGTLLHFLRTGDPRWYELLDPLARHVIDIDIYHTGRDKAGYSGGMFWHTDHYLDAATSTHRAFSRANQPAGRPYGGGPCNEHNYTTGLLHYYFLTGDPGAREAVISLADWVVAMDDGRGNVLGIVDGGPTGLASRTRESNFHGPGRGCGNSINALLDGWLVTGRRGYLEKAESLIRRSVHPAEDLAALDLLDAENRWSYTVFLVALARFLDLKAEAGDLDFSYAYARASLLRYAAWMKDNEVPYLDHPEKLEFPTETWAAQELRKANVFRLAAVHAEEPLRAGLLRRSHELAERAWSDLLGFESRAVTRALALVMTEGLKDTYFRSTELKTGPRPTAEHDFGSPEAFVPQRRRVLAQLKTIRGLGRAFLKVINPSNWRKSFLRASR